MKKIDSLKNKFMGEQIFLKSRNFSCYSKYSGYLKNLMIERMMEQQDWYEEDEISDSPYGANPARFSINELNSKLFYYCIFKHLYANSNMEFITALRSDKQEYFHGGGATINHYVYNPNDIRESHYLFRKIISNINDKLKNTKNIKNNDFEEDNFYFNPLEDNLQEIQIFYIIIDSKLNFEMSNKYPFSPVYASKAKINRTINSKSGLLNKISINKWFKMNYINVQNKPNNYFLDKYLVQKDKLNTLIKFKIPKNFNFYFYQSLYHLINNNLIKKKNYFLYLKNIPVNILLIICEQQINYYYCDILYHPDDSLCYSSHDTFKYDIISLYHELGNRIVLYCLKYLYSNYLTKNNIKLKYDDDNNLILLNSTKLDFLSFTEFKNKTIKEFFDLDTNDLIELGRDLYLFTIFNYYLCENTSKFSSSNLNNKSLTITFPINVNYINFYYPSRNKINKMLISNPSN